MNNSKNLLFLQPTPSLRELQILLEIDKNKKVSQNSISEAVGIAPSMVNNYLKDFVEHELVLMEGKTHRKVNYFLTEKGAARRIQLLSKYMVEAVKLYKNAKFEISERLKAIRKEGIRRVVFYGAGETAEIAYTASEEIGFDVLAIVDSDVNRQGANFIGKTILPPSRIRIIKPEAVIITSLGYTDEIYTSIQHLEGENIKIRKI